MPTSDRAVISRAATTNPTTTNPAATSDRRAVWGGLLIVAALAVVYPSIASAARDPLAVFLLAPLFTAIVSGPRQTALVGSVATAVALAQGVAGPLEPVPLAARLGIVVAATLLAVVAARSRRRREAELSATRVRSALSESFQGGLVPSPRPPSWLEAETRYVPGSRGLMLGGDFVDVITLPDGAAAFVIGDVCGHGPRAAAFGTAIRAAWKGIASTLPADPLRWLGDVEAAYFLDGRFDGFVTALTGRIEVDGRLLLVSAGHPWPVLVDGGNTSLLRVHPSLPLGTGLSGERHLVPALLDPGAALLTYTDGLLENRRGPHGIADDAVLLDVVDRHAGQIHLDELLDAFGPHGFDDDVALLRLTRRTHHDTATAR